jgi:hypothetical protein
MSRGSYRSPIDLMLNPLKAFGPAAQQHQPPAAATEMEGSAEALAALKEAALAWWQKRRPAAWNLEQHLASPTEGCSLSSDKALAEAVAQLVRLEGEPTPAKVSAPPVQAVLSATQRRAMDILKGKPLTREEWRAKGIAAATMQSLVKAGVVSEHERGNDGGKVWQVVESDSASLQPPVQK